MEAEVGGSPYIRRQPSKWVGNYLRSTTRFPARIFLENFRVPCALYYRLVSDQKAYDATKWSTPYDAIGKVGIADAVTVLVCLKRLGTLASLQELADGAQMGK